MEDESGGEGGIPGVSSSINRSLVASCSSSRSSSLLTPRLLATASTTAAVALFALMVRCKIFTAKAMLPCHRARAAALSKCSVGAVTLVRFQRLLTKIFELFHDRSQFLRSGMLSWQTVGRSRNGMERGPATQQSPHAPSEGNINIAADNWMQDGDSFAIPLVEM